MKNAISKIEKGTTSQHAMKTSQPVPPHPSAATLLHRDSVRPVRIICFGKGSLRVMIYLDKQGKYFKVTADLKSIDTTTSRKYVGNAVAAEESKAELRRCGYELCCINTAMSNKVMVALECRRFNPNRDRRANPDQHTFDGFPPSNIRTSDPALRYAGHLSTSIETTAPTASDTAMEIESITTTNTTTTTPTPTNTINDTTPTTITSTGSGSGSNSSVVVLIPNGETQTQQQPESIVHVVIDLSGAGNRNTSRMFPVYEDPPHGKSSSLFSSSSSSSSSSSNPQGSASQRMNARSRTSNNSKNKNKRLRSTDRPITNFFGKKIDKKKKQKNTGK